MAASAGEADEIRTTQGMGITPPFGYAELHPLQKSDRVLVPQGATPDFCRTVNAIALSYGELAMASRDYPIVFAASRAPGEAPDAPLSIYAPVAVLGLADKQNLYVSDQGEWEPGVYVPAFIRRYPFCVARVLEDGGERDQRVVCVERAYVDREGVALYDADGKATPQWRAYEQLLQEYEADLDRTAQMCSALTKLDLFAPFEFQVLDGSSPALTLQGMHRIDEQKLADLKAPSHKALVTKGFMGRIYAHLHSLENFARLYARAVGRAQAMEKRRREGIHR